MEVAKGFAGPGILFLFSVGLEVSPLSNWWVTGSIWMIALTWALAWLVFFRPRGQPVPTDPPVRASKLLTATDVAGWLRTRLADSRLGVDRAYLFGSVVHPYPSTDVDVAIIFDLDEPTELKRISRRIARLKAEFQSNFGLPLHITSFSRSESASGRSSDFLGRNTIMQIVGEEIG